MKSSITYAVSILAVYIAAPNHAPVVVIVVVVIVVVVDVVKDKVIVIVDMV